MPTSKGCHDTYVDQWAGHYGYCKGLRCDRGLHNRAKFCRELESAGVRVKNGGLDAPWQIGKTEREGGIWKDIARKVIHQKKVTGFDELRLMCP